MPERDISSLGVMGQGPGWDLRVRPEVPAAAASGIWGSGNLEIWESGNLGIWKCGNPESPKKDNF